MSLVVCIIVATLPWNFGPYQSQGDILARGLDKWGYKVHWMMHSPNYRMPAGPYDDENAMLASLQPETATRERFHPPRRWKAGHISYIGLPSDGTNLVRVTELNRIADAVGVNIFITLFDLSSLLWRDTQFNVPAICWLPLHYYQGIRHGQPVDPIESFVVSAFSGVAALSPSGQALLSRMTSAPVAWVPHVVEGPHNNTPRCAPGGLPPDTFIVLFQGGNYDADDRKGLGVAVEAFERFFRGHPRAHLYVHAVGSREIASDEHKQPPPDSLLGRGLPLHLLLAASNLPAHAYTIDTAIHPTEWVWGLKRAAHVCLHPSKTEGFGVNVLECQLVGTPVVTTAYGAMGDYTRFGIAVPHKQVSFHTRNFVAMPDVGGVHTALERVYEMQGAELSIERQRTTREWVRSTFSSHSVTISMDTLLHKVLAGHKPAATQPGYTPIRYGGEFVAIDTLWVLLVPVGVQVVDAMVHRILAVVDKGGIDIVLVPPKGGATSGAPGGVPDYGLCNSTLVLGRTQLYLQAQVTQPTLRTIAGRMLATGHKIVTSPWAAGSGTGGAGLEH